MSKFILLTNKSGETALRVDEIKSFQTYCSNDYKSQIFFNSGLSVYVQETPSEIHEKIKAAE